VKKDYEKRVQEVVSLMRQRYGISPRKKPAGETKVMGDVSPADPTLLQS
jgi:hypothetical protein